MALMPAISAAELMADGSPNGRDTVENSNILDPLLPQKKYFKVPEHDQKSV